MRRKRQSSRRGAAAIIVQLSGISLACAALLAGYAPANAQAQDPASKEKPKAKPEVGPQPDPNARPRPRVRRKPKIRSGLTPRRVSVDELNARDGIKPRAGARGLSAKRKRSSKTSFAPDPNAKWACDKQTIVHKPIWRGRNTLTYEFNIRNEGTANLRIKASGG